MVLELLKNNRHGNNFKDRTGERFGKLTILSYSNSDKYGNAMWKCRCDCGKEKIINVTKLVGGYTRSCGCLQIESCSRIGKKYGSANYKIMAKHNITHGMSRSRLYEIWRGMLSRCESVKNISYSRYGGRGITVCFEWHNFEPFMCWALKNGYRDNLTIDRKDNNGNYNSVNCRWVTYKEQALNRDDSKIRRDSLGRWAQRQKPGELHGVRIEKEGK